MKRHEMRPNETKPNELIAHIRSKEDEIIDFLREIVEMESPTIDRAAVNKVSQYVRQKAEGLGAEIEIVPSNREDRGDHLIASWPGQHNDLDPLLVMAHLDTVYEVGTLQKMPFKVEGNKIYGPGVFDMKGAVVFLLTAIQVLQELGKQTNRPIRCLFNSDEEMNSATSREVIDREARKAHSVLVLEGGVGDAVLTSRKGIMYFKIEAIGKSSHAGMDHAQGINAIEEMAHHILNIQRQTNYDTGTTVSCGIIQGGTRTNVIPSQATLEVDARVATQAEALRLKDRIEALTPVLPGAKLDIYTLIKRPPLERTDGVVQLYHKARQLAAELGYDLPEASTGAISDGNLTAAIGVPTLDGLGPIGEGAHSSHEHILKDKIAPRLALLVKLLEKL